MKSFSLILFLLPVVACAQPATYRDGVLNIPEAAVTDPGDPSYYTDVQLQVNGDGDLQIVAAEPTNPVTVEDVTVMIMESFPVQVSVLVSGYKSVPCVTLLTPAVDRVDNVFTVVMAESILGPAESCIAIIDPFEVSVALNVLGLSAGTYSVNVNGVVAEFTLDTDNVPADQ